MPRQKPVRVLLVDEDWIYELSALNAESKLLKKHSDKIHQLHYDKLQSIVGRCFVDELVKVKKAADSADKKFGEDWTDKIDKKYKEVLEHQDFRAWYAKTLEYLVTLFSTGEFKGDGLVKYERDLEDGIVRNVSTRERKERQDSVLRYLPTLDANLIEHVVKPNILLFSCLKTKFDTAEEVKPYELDYFVPVAGASNYDLELERPIVINNYQSNGSVEKGKTKFSYSYIASPLNGAFTIDYSDDIENINDHNDIEVFIYNSLGQLIDRDYNPLDSGAIKVWVHGYDNAKNLTGTIVIGLL